MEIRVTVMTRRKTGAGKGRLARSRTVSTVRRRRDASLRKRHGNNSAERIFAAWPAVLASLIVLVLLMAVVLVSTKLTGMLVLPDTDPPSIYGPTPVSGSYVPGGLTAFYVHATDQNMNDSSVTLTIKASANPDWDTYSMPCVDFNVVTGVCDLYGTTISLNIVGSDTMELYYFGASDLLGTNGSLGSVQQPLVFTVDTNPPEIQLSSPTNKTYVSNNTQIDITVTDASSGVNDSTVAYSFDNSSWVTMAKGPSKYYMMFDTSGFGNNDTANFYFKAADVMNNTKYAYAQFLIDNELPSITVTGPANGMNVSGVMRLALTSSDVYSGFMSASYTISGSSGIRGVHCDGLTHYTSCEDYMNTIVFSDGPHTMTFTVRDVAGNANYSTVIINIDNRVTALTITAPTEGSYLSNTTSIGSVLTNGIGKATGVRIFISGSGYSALLDSVCDANFNCHATWDTTQVNDGQYTLFANATGSLTPLNYTVHVTVDNTKPSLGIDSPINANINGTAFFRTVVTDDYGVNMNSISYSISTYTNQPMYCSMYVQGKKYVCSAQFDTTKLPDNYYGLYFRGGDVAGNTNSVMKTVLVDNSIGVGPEPIYVTNYTDITTTTTTLPAVNEPGGSAGTTTTTQEATQGETNSQNTVPGNIAIILGDIQNSLAEMFKSWPVRALAVSMIVFLAVIALFRTTPVKRFLEKKEEEWK